MRSACQKRIFTCFVFSAVICAYQLLAGAPCGALEILFLHHSTGGGVYYEGGVPERIDDYNSSHGTAFRISERSYPDSPYPWENYPYDYWNLWINGACESGNPNVECIENLTQNYDVIIFKHCFPGAAVESDSGSPDVASPVKTLENYKAQYRTLRDMMDSYPDNLFIVWTLAPLHRLATTSAEAARAKKFVDWVTEDFLTEDGSGHPNIALFDFWGIVAEDNPQAVPGQVNCLKYEYEASHVGQDSHPNATANQTAGPQFAELIVDAAADYFGEDAAAGDDNQTDPGNGDDDSEDDYDDESCLLEESCSLQPDDLERLRAFRDEVLARSAPGRLFIEFYYRNQAALSNLLQKRPFLKRFVQHCAHTVHTGSRQ